MTSLCTVEERGNSIWCVCLHQHLPPYSSCSCGAVLRWQPSPGRPHECWSSGLFHALPAVSGFCLPGQHCFNFIQTIPICYSSVCKSCCSSVCESVHVQYSYAAVEEACLDTAIVQTVLPSCGCVKGHKYLFIPGHMRWLRHAQSQPSRKTLCMLLT